MDVRRWLEAVSYALQEEDGGTGYRRLTTLLRREGPLVGAQRDASLGTLAIVAPTLPPSLVRSLRVGTI